MTRHGLQRTEEHTNLSANAAIKLVNHAELKGKTSEDFPAAERRYLENVGRRGRIVRVYADYVFIFSLDNRLITMFHVPGWFGKKSKYCGKVAVRNPRKYERFHAEVS